MDEAYYEYAGETAAGLIDEGVVVLRTFSKAFGLAGGRVGYALADAETAAELNRRQSPARSRRSRPRSPALADPPDVSAQVEARAPGARPARSGSSRCRRGRTSLRPGGGAGGAGRRAPPLGLVVRVFPDGIRPSVRDPRTTTSCWRGRARALDRPAPVAASGADAATCGRPRRACAFA